MSQISRLHNTEIANGNLIDATHLNNEFDQLVAESNSQDTRLNTAETNITGLTNSLAFSIHGLVVEYSTANRVVIKPGLCRDSSNTELMEITTDLTVDLSVSGANGLDTGTEAADTWYYLWLIKNPSTGVVAGLFSASGSSPVLPSGYTKKRLLPIAVRNDASSNILPFIVAGGWPGRPVVLYRDFDTAAGNYQALNGGTATNAFTSPGGGVNVDLRSWVPPVSRVAILNAYTAYSSGGLANAYIKDPDSNSTTGERVGVVGSNATVATNNGIWISVNVNQFIKYRMSLDTSSLTLYVRGFVVTEVS